MIKVITRTAKFAYSQLSNYAIIPKSDSHKTVNGGASNVAFFPPAALHCDTTFCVKLLSEVSLILSGYECVMLMQVKVKVAVILELTAQSVV